MARGVNKVILIGNIGQEPDVRYLPSGNPVCNLRLATTDSWNDRQSGQRQERTEWHSVVLFNKLAEIAQQYVHKGSRLYIEGRLQTRKWQGQDGQDRYSTEIVANDMQMLDSRNGGGNAGGNDYQGNGASQGGYQAPGNASQAQPQQGGMPPQGGNNFQQQPPQQQRPANNPAQGGGQSYGGGQPQQGGYGQPQQQGGGAPNTGAPNPGSFDDFDDEIPF